MHPKYLEKLITLHPELDTEDMREYIKLKKELKINEKLNNKTEISKIKILLKSGNMKYCSQFDNKIVELNIKSAIKLDELDYNS